MMRARRIDGIPELRQVMDPGGDAGLTPRDVEERLPLASLAARRATVERTVDGRKLPRLSRLCSPGSDLHVRLSFSREDEGDVRIDGELTGSLSVDCQRCLDAVLVRLSTAFSVIAVKGEADASRLGAYRDVLELQSEEPTIAELIEDELILALPQRPCAEADCEKAPPLAWPQDRREANNPFSSLAPLKKS